MRVVMFLSAGVVLSVVVAIACSMFAQTWPGEIVRLSEEEAIALRDQYPLDEEGLLMLGGYCGRKSQFGYEEKMIGTLSAWTDRPDEGRGPKVISDIRTGWPFAAMKRAGIIEPEVEYIVWMDQHRDLMWSPHVMSMSSDSLVLPTKPVLPGLIGNAMLYALALAALICVPRAVRGHLRLRRRQCPRCAYPIGRHEACTECGELLAKYQRPRRFVS